jgi:hypothetical protein
MRDAACPLSTRGGGGGGGEGAWTVQQLAHGVEEGRADAVARHEVQVHALGRAPAGRGARVGAVPPNLFWCGSPQSILVRFSLIYCRLFHHDVCFRSGGTGVRRARGRTGRGSHASSTVAIANDVRRVIPNPGASHVHCSRARGARVSRPMRRARHGRAWAPRDGRQSAASRLGSDGRYHQTSRSAHSGGWGPGPKGSGAWCA